MTITSLGYPGSISAGQVLSAWRQTFAGDYGVIGAGDLDVTAVAGVDRTVSIAAGTCFGKAVRDVMSAAQTVQLTTCSSGTRYDLIVVHRDSSGSGATTMTYVTGTTSITAAIGTRKTFEANATQDDQPIALVPVVGGTGGGVLGTIIDLRCWVGTSGCVALSTYTLQYLNAVGTQVRIGNTTWTRLVDGNGTVSWDSWVDPSTGTNGNPTDANGVVTISHTLGVIPSYVGITPLVTGSDLLDGEMTLIQSAKSATQVQFVARRPDGSPIANNPCPFDWAAFA